MTCSHPFLESPNPRSPSYLCACGKRREAHVAPPEPKKRPLVTRVYLAGPMTGIPQFNYPAFDAAAERLRALGYEVQSPAELDNPATRAAALASPDGALGSGTSNGETWGDFLARDVKLIADSGIQGIVCLEGWEQSRGARLETYVASLSGIPIAFYNPDGDLAFAHCSAAVVAPKDTDD